MYAVSWANFGPLSLRRDVKNLSIYLSIYRLPLFCGICCCSTAIRAASILINHHTGVMSHNQSRSHEVRVMTFMFIM